MAKIIEHNFSKETRNPREDLLTRSFSFYMKELEDKKALLGEMVMQARIFLAQEGMLPEEFVMSETYLRDFLFAPIGENESEKDRYAEMVYLKQQGDKVTALCQFAVPGDGDIAISYQIYRLDRIDQGNLLWQVYNFKSGNWMDDEEDCFDLKVVLREVERFSENKQE